MTGRLALPCGCPDGLERGEHLIEVRQGEGRDARVTSSVLLKAEADEFEEEVESRFVDQGVGGEYEETGGDAEGAT